jgi:arylsulfatase A-like enzyme
MFSRLYALVGFGLLAAGLLLAGCDDAEQAAPTRPNIVLIVVDDLGYGDLGSYGQQQIQTPHLDRMAAEGLRFTQFYAGSTVCAPSRSVLMTGQHVGRTPIRGNNEILPIGQQPLPDSSVTLAEMLREAGYRTGMFGKWGLGGPDTEGVPHRQGFDQFYGYIGQRRAHFYWPEFLFESNADSLWRTPLEGNIVEDNPERHPGSGPPVERGTYSHDAIMDRALSFIEESAGQQPFFAFLPVTIPHASVVAPEEAFAPYLDDEGNSLFEETPHVAGHYTSQPMPKAAYAAMVSHLDQGVGQILDRLDALGVAENTIVLFTSDNGPHGEGGYDPAYFDSNGPLRGMKRDLYEGGIRVPHLAWWPGRIEAGTTTDAIGYFGDYMATFAELAETSAPAAAVDSRSLMPVLHGEADTLRANEPLYWEFYEQGSKQAVRLGKWKAVRAPMMTGAIELYDLEADLSESNNVADAHPEVVERMEAVMERAHTPSADWSVPSPSE